MTLSLDGYVAGPKYDHDDPMRIGGFRPVNWLDHRNEDGPHGDVYAELLATRAFISSLRTSELANHWSGDHPDGMPIFVLTHHVADEPPACAVRFMTDVRDCATAARTGARPTCYSPAPLRLLCPPAGSSSTPCPFSSDRDTLLTQIAKLVPGSDTRWPAWLASSGSRRACHRNRSLRSMTTMPP